MLPHNERKWVGWLSCWYEVLHGWTRSQRPRGPLHETMHCLWLTCYQASRCWKPCLPVGLIADKVRGVEVSPREQEVAQISQLVANQSASVATESVWKGFQRTVLSQIKICQHLHSVASFVKHKINMFFNIQKILIKHHRSNGKD